MKINFKKILIGLILLNNNLTVHAEETTNYTYSPEIIADSGILIDANSGAILYEKNKDEINFPASTTKIMTALLVLEDEKFDLNNRVYFSENAIYSTPPGSSHIAMNEDETLTLEEALHGLLLESANEVANALSEYVAGDMDKFVEMMNIRAKELGALNTHFTNAHGFHDKNHYTTAYDLSLIMKEVIKHEEFVKIINTTRYVIPPTEKQELERNLNNSNRLILNGPYFYEYAIGGKTGYTDEARHTLVNYAKKDNMNLISIVLHDEKFPAFQDTIALFDYGFTQFEDVILLKKSEFNKSIDVINSSSETNEIIGSSKLAISQDINIKIPKAIKDKIKQQVNIPTYMKDILLEGEIVGRINFLYENTILTYADILANNTVKLSNESIEAFNQNGLKYTDNKKLITSTIITITSVTGLASVGLLLINNALKKRALKRAKRLNKKNYKYKH